MRDNPKNDICKCFNFVAEDGCWWLTIYGFFLTFSKAGFISYDIALHLSYDTSKKHLNLSTQSSYWASSHMIHPRSSGRRSGEATPKEVIKLKLSIWLSSLITSSKETGVSSHTQMSWGTFTLSLTTATLSPRIPLPEQEKTQIVYANFSRYWGLNLKW